MHCMSSSQSAQPTPSGRYTHGHEEAVLASHGARTAANSAGYLLDHLRPGMSLLDVGFGPGTITLDLAEAVAPGQVIGIENTEVPVQAARDRARARGDERTRFELGDVMELPFDDDSFDVVHAHQVLQHLRDPVGALREMSRVCRPGGRLAARDADYAAMAWFPDVPALERWRSLYRTIAQGNGAEPDAGRWLRSWARQAGLTEFEITSTNWCYADAESCRWWGNSQADRLLGDTFVRQAAENGVSASEVAELADGWRSWGSEEDAWYLIPSVELLAQPGR